MLVLLAMTSGLACNGKPADAPSPPSPDGDDEDSDLGGATAEALETGTDCATAEAVCDNGSCVATVENRCPDAVTCELSMMAICEGMVDGGQANGKGRDTIAAGATGNIEGVANCEGAAYRITTAESLTCE